MPTTLACPHCAILAVKDQDGDAVTIAYDYGAWTRSCSDPSVHSLILCPEMRPLLGLSIEDEAKVVEVVDRGPGK